MKKGIVLILCLLALPAFAKDFASYRYADGNVRFELEIELPAPQSVYFRYTPLPQNRNVSFTISTAFFGSDDTLLDVVSVLCNKEPQRYCLTALSPTPGTNRLISEFTAADVEKMRAAGVTHIELFVQKGLNGTPNSYLISVEGLRLIMRAQPI